MKPQNGTLKALMGWGLVLLLTSVFAGLAIAQTCVRPPPSLISWWDGEGDADDLENNNPGTMYGTTFAAGMVGQAFSFDGVDDRVEVPSSASLDITGPLSIDAWFKLTGPYSSQSSPIAGKWVDTDGGMAGYGLFLLGPAYGGVMVDNPNGKIAFAVSSTGTDIVLSVTPTPYPLNEWHHLAGVYDGTALKLYMDGVKVGEHNYAGPIHVTSAPLVMGSYNKGAFQGLVDEAEIFNRGLTDSEVLSIFNAGSAGKCKVTEISIDINPWLPNIILLKPSFGFIPVAILSTKDFNAPKLVDRNSLTFGNTGDENSFAFCDHWPLYVNRDRYSDLICFFYKRNAEFQCGDKEGILKGKTLQGTPIEGIDSVRVMPCK